MSKRWAVAEQVQRRFDAGELRPFTAGELARAAKVSVNTAKKWLKVLAEKENALIYTEPFDMENGLVATLYNFNKGGWL